MRAITDAGEIGSQGSSRRAATVSAKSKLLNGLIWAVCSATAASVCLFLGAEKAGWIGITAMSGFVFGFLFTERMSVGLKRNFWRTSLTCAPMMVLVNYLILVALVLSQLQLHALAWFFPALLSLIFAPIGYPILLPVAAICSGVGMLFSAWLLVWKR